MRLPGFALKLQATGRRIADRFKGAVRGLGDRLRAALSTRGSKPALSKRLVLVAAAVLGLSLALLLMLFIGGAGAGRRTEESLPAQAASDSQRYRDALLMPSPLPGELPFPLARERKSRYTEAEVQGLRPDLGSLPLGDSVERRKAELEAIYNAVD